MALLRVESTVRALSEKVAEIDRTIDEADGAGFGGPLQASVKLKMLWLGLLQVKSSAESRLEGLVLDCSDCGERTHYVPGLGGAIGHWAHLEPAPHGVPSD